MSIIQEALKKVTPKDRSTPDEISQPPEASLIPSVTIQPVNKPVIAAKKIKSRNPLRLVVILVMGAITMVVAAGAFYLFQKPSPAAQKMQASEPEPVPAPILHQDTIYKTIENSLPETAGTIPAAQTPAPASIVRAEPPELVLNGIMYLESGPRAIINNAIVGEGDMVNGATILTINKKNVILKFNNVEITLNLK